GPWVCWITNRGRGETVGDYAVRLTLPRWGGLYGALASPSFYQPRNCSRKRPPRPARNRGAPRPKVPANGKFLRAWTGPGQIAFGHPAGGRAGARRRRAGDAAQ